MPNPNDDQNPNTDTATQAEIPPAARGPTFGERTVRVSFNPGGNSRVDAIKNATARLIDLCNGMRGQNRASPEGSEQNRLASLAITAYEEAAMWAVKAATTGQP